jgi:hypothetical protein
MNVDKTPANSILLRSLGGGDTGRGRVERMSFLQLRFTLKLETSLSLVIAPICQLIGELRVQEHIRN